MKEFNIGQDFSPDPAGRFNSDGLGNGEQFREEYLRKMIESLEEGEIINIILDDDVEGYGSSFLVEGFAGIVKYGYMKSDVLLEKLVFEYTDPDFEFYKNKIIKYINEAVFNSKIYEPTELPANT